MHRGCASVGVDTGYVSCDVFAFGMPLVCLLLKRSGVTESLGTDCREAGALKQSPVYVDSDVCTWAIASPYARYSVERLHFGVLHSLAVTNFSSEQSFLFSKLSVVHLF